MIVHADVLKVVEKAKLLGEKGKDSLALRRLKEAEKKYPEDSFLLANIALIAQRLEKNNLAIEYYLKALNLDPENPTYIFNYGVLLYGIRKFDEGLKKIQKALSYERNSFYHLTFAKFLYNSGRTLEAEENLILAQNFDCTPKVRYQINWIKAHVYLRMGNLKTGWKFFESRLEPGTDGLNTTHDPMKSIRILNGEIPQWRGEDLSNKTIIINDEQGFGDTIQFSRYVLALGEKYDNITINFICKKELFRLFGFMPNYVNLFYREENQQVIEEINGDFHIFLMSIPLYFETNYESIYSKYPYISSEDNKIDYPFIVKDKLNIGISWSGNKANPNDLNRSIWSLEELEPLLSINSINFISLQVGSSYVSVEKDNRIIDSSSYIEDFKDSLDIIKRLDLIVTIDTALAHLSGAANIPCWVFLPKIATDWRWGENLKHCPWYKSLKIYKQENPDDWTVPINSVVKEIKQKFKI